MIKKDTLLILLGIAGLGYVITRKPKPKRNPRVIAYKNNDPEQGEIGLTLG
jgi:hypothetical protein